MRESYHKSNQIWFTSSSVSSSASCVMVSLLHVFASHRPFCFRVSYPFILFSCCSGSTLTLLCFPPLRLVCLALNMLHICLIVSPLLAFWFSLSSFLRCRRSSHFPVFASSCDPALVFFDLSFIYLFILLPVPYFLPVYQTFCSVEFEFEYLPCGISVIEARSTYLLPLGAGWRWTTRE